MSQQFVCHYWQTNRKVGQQRDRLWHPVAQWQVHTMYWQRFTSKWSRSCCMSILYWVLMRSIAFKLSYKAGQRCEGTAGHRDPGRTRVDSRRNVLLKYSPVLFVSVVGSGWPLCACLVQTDGWFHWVCVCVCVCVCAEGPEEPGLVLGARLFCINLAKEFSFYMPTVSSKWVCKFRAFYILHYATNSTN